jgi:hypothetical protein
MRRQVRIRALALAAGIEYEKRIHLFFIVNKITLHLFHYQAKKEACCSVTAKLAATTVRGMLIIRLRHRIH